MTSRSGGSVGGSSAYSTSMNGSVSSVSGPSQGSGGVNNRGTLPGLGVSPSMMGGAGPRITSSVSNMVTGSVSGGASMGRTINPGSGLNLPTFSGSRVNLGSSNVSGGVGMQGPGRPLSNVLQQGKHNFNSNGNLILKYCSDDKLYP